MHLKSDERILGDGDFVTSVLSQSQEAFERRYALKAKGVNLDDIDSYVGRLVGMESEEVWQPRRYKQQVIARSLLCFWAVQELDAPMTVLANRLEVSPAAVNKFVRRGRSIAKDKNYKFKIS